MPVAPPMRGFATASKRLDERNSIEAVIPHSDMIYCGRENTP
jgi:hypothetical protein